ncbi:type VI secretion system baseplate subunit TssG [Vibrio tapetis]|uniref:Type VI secretion protein VasB-1 n=1 Tax=Vibrio tapetis subsp. tapetis TaxID=1671868 RepID=A0A2N8ZJQ2_9VIBR|nr:type VI secretion system baseplate subunit TssG [Vibrio tapetis]SON52139.1 conserved protein of unknown function [Vibrio tapetis subsp. tapetis]
MNFIYDLASQPEKYDFVQAMRLLSRHKERASKPFQLELKAEAVPTGAANPIQYFSLKGNKAKLRLAKQALSGVKGVLPNYIYEELLSALYRDDHALKDFLDVFNQRQFEIAYSVETQGWLLLEQEQAPEKVALLRHLSALQSEHKNFFQYALLLGQSNRNLAVLKQILNDYFPYQINVECKLSERRQLPLDSLTTLGCFESNNSRLGQGFLLGKTCTAHFNHVLIFVEPQSHREFTTIQADNRFAATMLDLTQHYLRDNTQVSIYLSVKRAYLNQPILSAKTSNAARLGEVDCLAPERHPETMMKILLI